LVGGVLVCIGKESGQQVVITLRIMEIVGRWRGWSISMKIGWSWSAEMRAAHVAASVVLRRVVNSAARVGGRSAMMCGGDGGNVVLKKWV
jgi:hypothetical protein